MVRAALLVAAIAAAGCRAAPKPVVHRYALEGTVLAINRGERRLVVRHGDIPGYMPAMTMPYPIADAENIDRLETGDRIRAEIVVEGMGGGYLQNVVIVGPARRR